jgi:hypothetical protein
MMGRVIIKMKDGHLESFRCKSKERAKQIAGKRPNAKKWNYYEDNECIPIQKKKVEQHIPTSFEELEMMMRQQQLI